MTRRIGITNQKGGVAKTTNTLNVAGALAAAGHSVLAVDMDPQGYLTHRLGFDDAYTTDEASLYDALNDPSNNDVREMVVSGSEFDLLPANIDMFRLEQDLIASGMRPRLRLDRALEPATEWDFIVIDAPPSLGPLNDNVVLATDGILVPVEADESSQLALNHLLRQLDTLEDNYDTHVDILGIIVSDVDYPLDNEQKEAIAWFEDRFEGHVPVFQIRSRVGVKRAMQDGRSVFHVDAERLETVEDEYARIAREVQTND